MFDSKKCIIFGSSAFLALVMFGACGGDPAAVNLDPSLTPSNNDLTGATYIGSAQCNNCHDAQHAEWSATTHTMVSYLNANKNTCASCHTTGYNDDHTGGWAANTTVSSATGTATGTITSTHTNTATATTYYGPSDEAGKYGIQCEACHGPGSLHKVATTANKGLTINKVPDAAKTCQNCHFGRKWQEGGASPPVSPVVDVTDHAAAQAVVATFLTGSGTASKHPLHHGPNKLVLYGAGGYEYAGTTYAGPSDHATGISNSCVTCHVQGTPDHANKIAAAGNHDLTPRLGTCVACHAGLTTLDRDGKQTEIQTLIATLLAELTTYETAYIKDNRTHASYEKALWNYTLAVEDGSSGIHNYQYIKALLTDSIANFDPANP